LASANRHEDSGFSWGRAHRDRAGKLHFVRPVSPNEIVSVETEGDIIHLFKRYSPTQWKRTARSSEHRRRYVELVRPALRFYCHKFRIPVPDWLTDESQFLALSRADQVRLFGRGLLHPAPRFRDILLPRMQFWIKGFEPPPPPEERGGP
jgi:hypothetical protein